MILDFEAWRCCRDDKLFCPPEGCPVMYGCARDKGWKPGTPSPFAQPVQPLENMRSRRSPPPSERR